MDRRTFVSGSLALLAAPLVAEGQQPGKVARLGLLGLFTPELGARSVAAVREGWASWVGAKARTYISRTATRLGSAISSRRSRRNSVDVIVAFGTDATRAAREATSNIPIVMGAVADPVGSGFVTSLARPGGNVTGTSLLQTDLIGKQLQLLKEVAPRVSRIGVISLGVAHDPAMIGGSAG